MVEDMSSSEKAPDVAATLKCDNTSGISCSKTMNNLVAVSKHTRIWCERKLDNNRFGKSFEKPDAKNYSCFLGRTSCQWNADSNFNDMW